MDEKDREETVLANIAKVSPAFVEGYKKGRKDGDFEQAQFEAEWAKFEHDNVSGGWWRRLY